MVVKKGGTPVSAKKKTVEELKKLNEKKKVMMEEESDEEDTSDEEEEEDDSEMEEDEVNDDEGSDEDDDDDDDDDNDDDDDDEEDDDDDDDEEDEDTIDSPKKQKSQIQTPAKSKTPNKQSLLSSLQKSEVQSNQKTPSKGKVQSESPVVASPKKSGKTSDDSSRTPSPSKQQKNKSLVKGTAEKRKREVDSEEGTLKKPRGDSPAAWNLTEEQKRQRDRRCLFIRQVPLGTTEDDVKDLSSDIISVRFPSTNRKRKLSNSLFGFVEFASEEKAEENFPVLQKAKLKGQKLYVDYAGEKSKNLAAHQAVTSPRSEDRRRLYLAGLPQSATMEDIGKHFPNAVNISMKLAGNTRIANIQFETSSEGEEALKKNSALKIKGQSITVMFAVTNKPKHSRKAAKKKPLQPRAQPKSTPTANQKKKQESEEEDDDESEEDDDDDDDDDDDSDEE